MVSILSIHFVKLFIYKYFSLFLQKKNHLSMYRQFTCILYYKRNLHTVCYINSIYFCELQFQIFFLFEFFTCILFNFSLRSFLFPFLLLCSIFCLILFKTKCCFIRIQDREQERYKRKRDQQKR